MSAPEEVVDLCTACIASVNATVGVELDFSPDTLSLLDHYAKEVIESSEEEILALIAPMAGAYFGEVLCRHFNGRWHAPKDEHAEWRVELEPVFLFVNPVGVALDVILDAEGPYPSAIRVHEEDMKRVEEALKVYGDVRESDYFRFSVRFEALEQAVSALARRSNEPGNFTHADYESFLAEQAKKAN